VSLRECFRNEQLRENFLQDFDGKQPNDRQLKRWLD